MQKKAGGCIQFQKSWKKNKNAKKGKNAKTWKNAKKRAKMHVQFENSCKNKAKCIFNFNSYKKNAKIKKKVHFLKILLFLYRKKDRK